MLFLVATPIGNLGDLSPRAIEILKKVDCILAEDTRRTKILTSHFSISSKVVSFPAFAEKRKLEEVLNQLERGEEIAIVSDAGMPGICDPGTFLVEGCHQRGIPVDVIPGPSAVTTIASLSGLCEEGFVFVGYFPQKQSDMASFFKKLEMQKMPVIFFEAPHRLHKTLEECKAKYPTAKCFLARELTKKFQEYTLGSVNDVATLWEKKEPKGEFALCLKIISEEEYSEPIEEILVDIAVLKKEGCSLKTACKVLAKRSKFSHQELYKMYLAQNP